VKIEDIKLDYDQDIKPYQIPEQKKKRDLELFRGA